MEYITTKQHHKFRQECTLDLATEFSDKKLPIIERITRRFEIIASMETPIILENEKICFLRTVSNLPEVLTEEEISQVCENHYLHHTNNICPNYYKAIKLGLSALRDEADEYGKRCIDAIFSLTERYRQAASDAGRQDLADMLERVPRHGATTFHEALQMFRILHFALWLEGGIHVVLGRFDKHMYPYLKADIDKGILTEADALELLEEFFLSFNRDSDLYPGVQLGDNGQSMMLGGIDAQGNDVYNLLTSMCMKASFNNKLIDPKINLRVSSSTPVERLEEATMLTKAGLGFPQYSNDDVVIPALEKLGYSHEDATDYTVAACWEFIIPGYGNEFVNIDALSYPLAVDRALHRDLAECATFTEFFGCVESEIANITDDICEKFASIRYYPLPFINVLMDCDIYKPAEFEDELFTMDMAGKYTNFGIHGAGIATAANSLAAIKKYVYEDKTISKAELIEAIDDNFAHTPELLHTLRYDAPKFGNNDDYADDIAVQLLDAFSHSLEHKTTYCGSKFRAGTGSAMYYLWCADEIGASPDGRLKGEPFGTNFSVSLFAKIDGPISLIASMTKPHFENAVNGGPLTMEFHPSVFATDEGIHKIAMMLKTYIAKGGHQLQLNTLNAEQLIDAQKHPEAHRQLIVRIWGWSAYFVELDESYQNHVMARQVYSI